MSREGKRMKEFNTTAVCIPAKHYMVDLSERVKEIKKMVDAGKYFTINRARQYGKTTTLKSILHIVHPDSGLYNLGRNTNNHAVIRYVLSYNCAPPNHTFITYMYSWANQGVNANKTVIPNIGILEIVASVRFYKDMLMRKYLLVPSVTPRLVS